MAAILEARGTGASGEQPNGIAAQYQLVGTSTIGSTTITPYDSGTILGTTPPGKAGIKLIDGTIQNATDLICDSTVAGGNSLLSTNQPTASGDPTVNSAQIASNGLSLSPQTE